MTQPGPYTEAQKAEYVNPPCPRCGAPSTVDWIDVSTALEAARDERVYLPGLHACTARCRETDPAQRFGFAVEVLETPTPRRWWQRRTSRP